MSEFQLISYSCFGIEIQQLLEVLGATIITVKILPYRMNRNYKTPILATGSALRLNIIFPLVQYLYIPKRVAFSADISTQNYYWCLSYCLKRVSEYSSKCTPFLCFIWKFTNTWRRTYKLKTTNREVKFLYVTWIM